MLSLGYQGKRGGGGGSWGSITGVLSDQTDLDNRFQSLENKNVKALWFSSINSGTSGIIAPPAGGTVKLDQFAEGVDALVCGISGGFPTYEPVRDSSGNIVAATLDGSGNYVLSSAPASYPVAILFFYTITFEDFNEQYSLGEYEKDVVKRVEIENVTSQTVIGRNSAGTGVSEFVTASNILDWIGSTRGQLLYRGAASWSVLSPGTSGYALISNGAGADPSYANLVNSGTQYQLAFYATTAATISGNSLITTDANNSLIVTRNNIGTTSTMVMQIVNNQAAANGAQQMSGAMEFLGYGWRTNATAESQAVRSRLELLPVQGSANPTGDLNLKFSINNAAYTQTFAFSSGGTLTLALGSVAFSTANRGIVGVGTNNFFNFSSTSLMTISTASAGSLVFVNNNGGAQLTFSNLAFTFADTVNLVFGTTTGTKIGTTTSQKIGIWGATPIVQPASANQAAVATTSATNVSPYGYTTQAQADGVITLLNEIRSVLVNFGAMKGAA